MLSEPKAALALQRLREAETRTGSLGVEPRRVALKALRRLVSVHAEEFCRAIAADFGGRSFHETRISEIGMALGAIDYALPRLARWSRPERVDVGWRFRPASARILKQPLGVVGIIAPWNYPLQLSLLPLVGALSAGCRAVVKPSEHTPATSGLLCRAVAEHLDPEIVRLVEGGPDEAAAMASLAFDKLLFTGSTRTGRDVLRATAETLVPTLLELGGKSPAIVDETADLRSAAADIVAGKLLNAGQTCVAPDFALVPRRKMDAFVLAAKGAADRHYPDPRSPDYTAICRPGDRVRLANMLRGLATVPLFTEAVPDGRMAPVLVIDPPADGDLMREEIFGPILPVVPYDSMEDVYRTLAARPTPLALYWFGADPKRRDEVLARTRSGGVSINDTVMHVAVEALPFGGLGQSGMGAYHGRAGFEAFTHRRAVFTQARFAPTRLLRPPYGKLADRIVTRLAK